MLSPNTRLAFWIFASSMLWPGCRTHFAMARSGWTNGGF
jgi:hypothetical protein